MVLPITVTFTENVYVNGTLQITLETGTFDAVVNNSSGSGTNTLVFNYVVAPGEVTPDLEYSGSAALALISGTIKDAVGNNAVLTLPATGASGSLGLNKSIIIDTTAPTLTYTNIFPASPGNTQTPQVSLDLTEPVTVLRLYSDASCSAAISPASTGTIGPNTVTTNTLTANASTTIYGQGTDAAGNVSLCTLLTSYQHDGISPTVTSVSSSSANGSYGVGQTVAVTVVFSEPVLVSGTPQITLETGSSDAVVNMTSGTGTNTLTFNYTVRAGDTTGDLDYLSNAALALNGGIIKDPAENLAVLSLPNTGGANSIAGQKNIVIDTTAPVITYQSVSPSSPAMSQTPTLTLTMSETATVTLYSNGSCSSAISTPTLLNGGVGRTISTNALT